MKRILVATDFSTSSDRALRRATLLAKRYEAELTIAHVIEAYLPPAALDAEKRQAEDALTQLSLSLIRDDGISCSYRVAHGEAAGGILQIARETQAELIIIGPHRLKVLEDIFVSTTADQIIAQTEVPVLMAIATPLGQFGKAMITTDLTPASVHAVRRFQTLFAPHLEARDIMHAFSAPALGQMQRAMLDKSAISAYIAEAESTARQALEDFMAEAEISEAKPVLKVNDTKAAHAILAATTAANADLLVISIRSRTGLAKLLLGSTAKTVLGSAQIDVLAVPPE